MGRLAIQPTGRERTFGDDELIVSKTDTRGVITYANTIFVRISGYSYEELIGQPHSLLRHPDMPRCVFKVLWDELGAGREVFAYINNLAKDGDHYWVLAHVTPSMNSKGVITGYHSNRRTPYPDAVVKAKRLYDQLLAIEKKSADRKMGLSRSHEHLVGLLAEVKQELNEFTFGLSTFTSKVSSGENEAHV